MIRPNGSKDRPIKDVTIGVLSRRTGCNVETIRYYERIGLLPAPPRTPGGHRLYRPEHVKRLSFIRRSRELGFPLAQVRGLLALVDRHEYSCAEVKELTLDHLARVHRKISDLRRMEKALAEMASQCDGGIVPDCPIIDALFEPPA